MKTLKEMYEEVMASEELENEILAADDLEAIEAILKKHGCNEPAETFLKYVSLKTLNNEEGELTDDEVEQVVGGASKYKAFHFVAGQTFFEVSPTPGAFWTSEQQAYVSGYQRRIIEAYEAGDMKTAKYYFDKCLNYMDGHVGKGYLWQIKGAFPDLVD